MHCVRIVGIGVCGFEYDPDELGTPAEQHELNSWQFHLPIWSTESEM